MMRIIPGAASLAASLAALILAGCASMAASDAAAPAAGAAAITERARATSPDERIVAEIWSENGVPTYRVTFDGAETIAPSRLGFRFVDGPNMDDHLALVGVEAVEDGAVWEQPWGERRMVFDHHNEVLATFRDPGDPRRTFAVRLRVFDDGVGFRYEVPATRGVRARAIADELTEFALPGDVTAWWIPAGGWNRYEELYRTTGLSEVQHAHTPFTARLENGTHVSIHEAALVDYAGMWLNQRRPGVLKSELAPAYDGVRVRTGSAFKTPWRTIQIADAATGLVNSSLILNLNEPNALGDVSWFQPGKYVGMWWCMHLGRCTWGSGPNHGATTENVRAYIDFAAENGFSGVLVEGWNVGWDGDWFSNGDLFSFTEAYPDFDLEGLTAYAAERGVHLIGHHETSGSITNYENQLEDALDLYARVGVPVVKTGYVADGGDLMWRDADGVPHYEWHDGQRSVNHHLRVVREAAERHIAVNPHEPVKDTGLRRTYPNWIAREGARGQEYNAWGQPPNPPEHTALLPYTRMLSGPMDFTPGIFDLAPRGLDVDPRVETTLAKQLALYVVLYSPIQMAADLPENYAAHPDAFQFIKDVPTDWENSVALAGEVGDFIVMARQERGSLDWYLGALTDENARDVSVPLDFLDPGVTYEATIYRDGAGADWRANPYAFAVDHREVTYEDALDLHLATSGGAAVELKAKTRAVTIVANVPEGTGPVYLAASLTSMGPWRPDGALMTGEGRAREVTIAVPEDTLMEFKFTLGTWEHEGHRPPGAPGGNLSVVADAEKTVAFDLVDFDPVVTDIDALIDDWEGSGVLGRLVYWKDVESKALDAPARHVEIWLPPGYDESDARYPVIYAHDGQNLFDPRIANTGIDWGVDEAMMRAADTGTIRPAIVVGVWSTEMRGRELSPWDLGPDYARFLIDELMPRVNAEFRTLTGPENTFTMGSSMGGLISMYLVREHSGVFGACGCLSTHTPFSAANHAQTSGIPVPAGVDPNRPLIEAEIEAGATWPADTRPYFDYGTETLDAAYEPGHAMLRAWLSGQGMVEGRDFLIREYPGAAHAESFWRARVQDQLEWMLGKGE